MDKKIRYIKNTPARNGFEDDLIINSDDAALFDTIGDYMKGRSDLDDVQNDPDYLNTMEVVQNMVSFYNKNASKKEDEMFIRNNFTPEEKESSLTNEIANIKFEINENKLNEITSEWVREWHEKKQKIGISDPKTEEIRSFISDAISSPVSEPDQQYAVTAGNTIEITAKSRNNRSLIIRYSSLAAAALIGVFFLVRTLIPSSDPAQLFGSNYRPFDAMTTITRGANNSDNYSDAIANYKSGNYQTAALGFAEILKNDPSSVSTQFYLGLTNLALTNYDKAANLLSDVVKNSGEFAKEARWYLGLTYLETGDKQKAIECFKYLAGSQGFYTDRSEKILRGLK